MGLFCSVKKIGVAWRLILCFALVTGLWFKGYILAGTYLEFWNVVTGTREFLVTGFRRGTLLFPFLKICHLKYEIFINSVNYRHSSKSIPTSLNNAIPPSAVRNFRGNKTQSQPYLEAGLRLKQISRANQNIERKETEAGLVKRHKKHVLINIACNII